MKQAEQTTTSATVLSAFRSWTVLADVRGMAFEQLAREQMIVVEAIVAEGNEGVRSIMSLLKGYCKSDIDDDDIVRSKAPGKEGMWVKECEAKPSRQPT